MERQIDIPLFKIRCSAIGKIMTEPKGKSVAQKIADLKASAIERRAKMLALKPTLKSRKNTADAIIKIAKQIKALKPLESTPNLSQTCISFLESWVNEYVYQRRVEFTSKQTSKGTTVEEMAIVYASCHVDGMGLASKNTRRLSNDWMNGEPDVIGDEYVDDIKAPFTHDTLPLYSAEIPESDYEWQVLGYMELAELKKARVIYVLMSMPEDMIQREARWKLGASYSQEEYEAFSAQFRYDDLPPYLRIKQYEFEYDSEKIEAIKQRVIDCRKYIDTVIIPALESNAKVYYKP